MVAGAALFTTGMVASADYPPLSAAVEVDDPTPEPNGAVVATVTGCIPGETVDFVLIDSTDSDTCSATAGASLFFAAPVGGVAIGNLAAPGAPGIYDGTATLDQSEQVLPFRIEVEAATGEPNVPTTLSPALPPTGSNSNGYTSVAFGLLIAGGALLAVASMRRRRLPV